MQLSVMSQEKTSQFVPHAQALGWVAQGGAFKGGGLAEGQGWHRSASSGHPVSSQAGPGSLPTFRHLTRSLVTGDWVPGHP